MAMKVITTEKILKGKNLREISDMQWINVLGRIINFHNVEWIETVIGEYNSPMYVFHLVSGNNIPIQTVSGEQVTYIQEVIEDLFEMSGVVES